MTVATYAQDRFGFVQGIVCQLGVPISKYMPYFERFMGACLKAEIGYLATFFDREGDTIVEAPHPDTIQGNGVLPPIIFLSNRLRALLGRSRPSPKQQGKPWPTD